jgi:hypothetical protein
MTAVQEYAATVAGTPIVYSAWNISRTISSTRMPMGWPMQDELAFQNSLCHPGRPGCCAPPITMHYIRTGIGGAYTHNPQLRDPASAG